MCRNYEDAFDIAFPYGSQLIMGPSETLSLHLIDNIVALKFRQTLSKNVSKLSKQYYKSKKNSTTS